MRPYTVFPPALDSAALLGALPELSALCTVETLDLMQLDSTDVTAADRQRMAQAVWQNREKFDGFVLTHGTDTLAYTAALLTHLLPHFDKPLVLTGSMLPMGVPDSDAPRNLLDAFRTAADGRAGVYAVMNGQILHGAMFSSSIRLRLTHFSRQMPHRQAKSVRVKYTGTHLRLSPPVNRNL